MKVFDFGLFGRRFREIRMAQGLSLAELADKLTRHNLRFRLAGITEESLRQLEAGRRKMDLWLMHQLCFDFSGKIDDLIQECDLGYPREMTFHDYLSTHFAAEREYMALSTAEVAAQLGMTEEEYIDIEMGDAELPGALWAQVIDVLDLPLNDLWNLYHIVLEDMR